MVPFRPKCRRKRNGLPNPSTAEIVIPGTESPRSCSFRISSCPAKILNFCAVTWGHLSIPTPRLTYLSLSPPSCALSSVPVSHAITLPAYMLCHIHLFTFSCLPLAATAFEMQNNVLFGLIGSSKVSVTVQPTTFMSTITLSTVYRLGLLPLFDQFDHYAC